MFSVGSDSDVTIAVDINGATDLGSSVASGDLLLVADIDDSNNIKKTSVADIVGAVSAVSLAPKLRVILETQGPIRALLIIRSLVETALLPVSGDTLQ